MCPIIHAQLLPPVLCLRGPWGLGKGVCFTASWSGSEWMMGERREAECEVSCVSVAVFIKVQSLSYHPVKGRIETHTNQFTPLDYFWSHSDFHCSPVRHQTLLLFRFSDCGRCWLAWPKLRLVLSRWQVVTLIMLFTVIKTNVGRSDTPDQNGWVISRLLQSLMMTQLFPVPYETGDGMEFILYCRLCVINRQVDHFSGMNKSCSSGLTALV